VAGDELLGGIRTGMAGGAVGVAEGKEEDLALEAVGKSRE